MIYLVTSEEYSLKSTLSIVREAVTGVDYIQMREKGKSKDELIKLGKEIKTICSENNTKFIVNDNPYLAKEIDAHGVHVGQKDILKYPIKDIRKIIGDKIIGLSTNSIKQVKQSNNLDIDYIGYGPIFPTQAKDYSLGTDDIKEVLKISKKPVFFIGGIKLDNVQKLYDLGVSNIAVITAITKAKDIPAAIRGLKCN